MLHYLAMILLSLRITVGVRSTSSFLKPGSPPDTSGGKEGTQSAAPDPLAIFANSPLLRFVFLEDNVKNPYFDPHPPPQILFHWKK